MRGTAVRTGWLSSKEYRSVFSRVPRFCVDLVIRNERGEVLLSWRKIPPFKNTWHLPGGRVYFREPIDKAAHRIAAAELGTRVRVGKLLGYMEFLRENQENRKIHTVSLAFSAELMSKDLKGSFQADTFSYFSKIPKRTCSIHANFLKSISKSKSRL